MLRTRSRHVGTCLGSVAFYVAMQISAAAQHPLVRGMDFANVDKHALAAPPEASRTLESLAAYLGKGAYSDVTRARAIFRWIAANISYDVALFTQGSARPGGFRNQTAAEVLQSRKGVCGCYANLFEDLARRCGLKAVVVTGYSRGFGYEPGRSVTNNSHAWIAVSINEQWCLLDPTWGSGYINERNEFVRELNDYYFLVPSKELVLTHFPRDPKYQFLPNPVTTKAFEEFVYLKPAFFRMGLRLDAPVKAHVNVQSDLNITLFGDNRTQLAAGLWQGDKAFTNDYTFIQNANGRIEANVEFPAPGDYAVRLFAKKKGQEGSYTMAVEYGVTAAGAKEGRAGFPKVYEDFNERMCQLRTPMNRYLKAGTRPTFSLSVPGATKVLVLNEAEKEWTTLKRGTDFRGEARIAPGNVIVCAEFPGAKGYAYLLKYTGY